MSATKFSFQGWGIVIYSTLVISVMFALILLIRGIDEQSMRVAIRATARTSCIIFVSAFAASGLQRIQSNKVTVWLVRNRRYLGISLAVSHAFHAIAIVGLIVVTSGSAYKSDPGGNLGYLFIIAMTVTSFNSTASWLGERAWKILHVVGMYYLWLAFTYAFSIKLEHSKFIYLPFLILLVLALIVRFIGRSRRRKIVSQSN